MKMIWISIKISLKFVPKGPINNILALVQIVAWRQATSHYLNQWSLYYRRIYCLGPKELKFQTDRIYLCAHLEFGDIASS